MKQKKNRDLVVGAVTSAVLLLFQMVAALFKVRVLLSRFGYEYYSVFQSSSGIFAYLILIESGFSAAYLLKMYKPYSDREYGKVQSLYLGMQKMLRKAASMMILLVVLIALVYPLVIADNNIGFCRLCAIALITGLRFAIPYYSIVGKKQILNVCQKSYLISIIDSGINLVTDIVMIGISLFTDWSFVSVILISIFMLIPSGVIYGIIMHRYEKKLGFRGDAEPSFEASGMTRDIMAQKVAYLADNNIDQILLSTRDLFQTTIYGSFQSVISFPVSLVTQLIASFRGYIGVQLAGDAEAVYDYFRKLLSINFFLASVIACEFILQAKSFVGLWIGDAYKADNLTLVLFAVVLFRKCAANTITVTREGKNLYKESKKYTLLTAAVNLVLSLILVFFWGIKGVLIATIIADLFVLDFNNYKLVFNRVFNKRIDVLCEIIPSVLCILLSMGIAFFSPYAMLAQDTWGSFILFSCFTTIGTIVVVGIAFVLSSKYIRKAIVQVLSRKFA